MENPASGDTDRLLRRIEAGDRQAFEDLFACHRPYLRRVIGLRMDPRLRPRVDPSDVVQETHLEAVRRLPDYLARRPMSFRLWLRKTACERLQMAQRYHIKAGRRAVGKEVAIPDRSSLNLVQQLLAAGSTPSQRLDKAELARRVGEVLTQLSETDREILLMRNIEALSNHEVAEALEIEPATASQRYGRALIRLRKLMLENGLLESQR